LNFSCSWLSNSLANHESAFALSDQSFAENTAEFHIGIFKDFQRQLFKTSKFKDFQRLKKVTQKLKDFQRLSKTNSVKARP
jgi:hypothetical protein